MEILLGRTDGIATTVKMKDDGQIVMLRLRAQNPDRSRLAGCLTGYPVMRDENVSWPQNPRWMRHQMQQAEPGDTVGQGAEQVIGEGLGIGLDRCSDCRVFSQNHRNHLNARRIAACPPT